MNAGLRMKQGAAILLVLVATVACVRSGARQPPGGPPGSPVVGSQRAPGMKSGTVEALQLPIPPDRNLTHVDPDVFAAALGNDPIRIFEFVRDAVAYEVYLGSLRGPRGTLLALAGNSVDRAALLGAMLHAAGQRVRYARGQLPEREARALVDAMWQAPPEPVSSAGVQPALSPQTRATFERLEAATRRDLTLIRDRLKQANVSLTRDPPDPNQLVPEVQTHYWVQWQKDGTWTDLDPSFADAAPGRVYARVEANFPVLPADLSHQVTIRITVEESADGGPTTRQVLSHTVPAAGLAEGDVVLMHMPEGWSGPITDPAQGISGALQFTGRVKPVILLGGQVVVGQIFQQRPVTSGLSGVPGLLGAGEGPRLATAEWLEVEFAGPGGTRETVSREIFDLVGPAARKAGKTLTPDEVRSRLERQDAPEVTAAFYHLFFATGRIDGRHAAGLAKAATPVSEPLDLLTILRWTNTLYTLLSDTLLSRLPGEEGTIVRFYPDSPRLLITELSVAGGKPRIVLDLRRDRVRGLATGRFADRLSSARVFRGVVNGTLERVLLEHIAAEVRQKLQAPEVVSTSLVFDRAAAEQVPILILPQERARLEAEQPEDGRARLEEDLSQGHLAVVPQRAVLVEGRPRLGWWRVDPRSGETVAVTDEGLYGSGFEVTVERGKGKTKVEVTVKQYVGSEAVTGVGPAPVTRVYDIRFAEGMSLLANEVAILLTAGGAVNVLQTVTALNRIMGR